MDKEYHQEIVNNQIDAFLDSLFPRGEGHISRHQVGHVVRQVATRAFSEGGNYALASLLTVEDVAERFGVTPRRVRALARNRHERFGIGWQVPGTNQWLFRPEELEKLQPNDRYRRKAKGKNQS